MPTKLPRLNVTIDSELAHALDVARRHPELCRLPVAARVRALAIWGARAIEEAVPLTGLERELIELGATLPTGDLLKASERLRGSAPTLDERGETASETLTWVRGQDRER